MYVLNVFWLHEILTSTIVAFYKEKQKRRGGDEAKFAECIRISPADELGICKFTIPIPQPYLNQLCD